MQTTPPTINHHYHHHHHLTFGRTNEMTRIIPFFPSPRNTNLSTYEPWTTPISKALGTALERLRTLNLSSSLPYTPHHCRLPEQTGGQQDTLIYAYQCTNIPLCLIALYFFLSAHKLWHGGFRWTSFVGIRSIWVLRSIPSAFIHPFWFIVLLSFIAHQHHHPTPTRRHTPVYLIFSCYKPALKANVLFLFLARFSSPLSLFPFFTTIMVALCVSICILRFPVFFLCWGGAVCVYV